MSGPLDRFPANWVTALLLVIVGSSAVADIYRWRDDDGKLHFTDEPPPGQRQGETVERRDLNTSDPVPNVNYEVERRDQTRVRRVVLKRNEQGYFAARGSINGQSVTFLVDTGASQVSVPVAVAKRLGLERREQIDIQTANGVAEGYLTRLNTVSVGGIQIRNVEGTINPGADFNVVLLGMSFMKQVDFAQRGQRLILRQTVSR